MSDWLAAAERTIDQIGGFNGNGSVELAPAATACALVGIGIELRRIADALVVSATQDVPEPTKEEV